MKENFFNDTKVFEGKHDLKSKILSLPISKLALPNYHFIILMFFFFFNVKCFQYICSLYYFKFVSLAMVIKKR